MCVFCLEGRDPEFAKIFLGDDWPYAGRILASDEHMYAIPGYGPQVFPYVLIVSRRHFSSLSESDSCERESIFSVLAKLRALSVFGPNPLCVFEHGGCGGSSHACIDHFHLHVIDGSIDLSSQLNGDYETEPVVVSPRSTFAASGRYLFTGRVSKPDLIEGTLVRSTELESQYFRRKIAEATGQDGWDWRAGMNPDFMVRVMQAAKRTEPQVS
jgi:diadenosine tetraphosphate (Ap4A) HIT family hydrolase